MVLAGLVIETLPQRATSVARRLDGRHGLEIRGSDGERRLAAVWKGDSGEALEALSKQLVSGDEEVLGVFPTFVGQDEP